MTKQSEFGKGFSYCLGLFLAHAESDVYKIYPKLHSEIDLWFNAAADHLYDIETDPVILGDKCFASRVKFFQNFCLDRKCGPTKGPIDKSWAIDEAKSLLLEWDNLKSIPAKKGEYE
jgi:hypothetical protein